MKNIGIFYPGEMGRTLAAKLGKGGFTVLSCTAGRSKRTQSAAVSSGIQLRDTLEEVIVESDAVCSLVPPEHALSSASVFADTVRKTTRKPLFVDCNSVSPSTVKAVATTVNSAGADCADGVFIGSAGLLDTKTVLYLSGAQGKALAMKFKGALRVVYLGETLGEASALKLCFASFNKGLIALFLEVACAGGKTAHRNELISCLENFYPGTMETVRRLLPSYPQHAHRRVKEMEEMITYLQESGQRPAVVPGIVSVLEAFSALFAEKNGSDEPPESISFEDITKHCISRGMLSGKTKD